MMTDAKVNRVQHNNEILGVWKYHGSTTSRRQKLIAAKIWVRQI